MAFAAWVRDNFTAAMTGRTGLLHSKKALPHRDLASTMTGGTGLGRSAFFGATAIAAVAGDPGWYLDIDRLATNSIFQAQFQVVAQIGATLRPRLTATTTATENIAKHIAEDIAKVGIATKATGTTAWIHAVVTIAIVGRTLLLIRQNFMGFLDFLEFHFKVLVAFGSVRVILHRQTFVGLLDVFDIGAFLDAQYFIIVTL